MFDTDCGISILQVCILFGGGTMQNFIFDSHAHYDDEAFEEDRHQVIQSLRQKEFATSSMLVQILSVPKIPLHLLHSIRLFMQQQESIREMSKMLLPTIRSNWSN